MALRLPAPAKRGRGPPLPGDQGLFPQTLAVPSEPRAEPLGPGDRSSFAPPAGPPPCWSWHWSRREGSATSCVLLQLPQQRAGIWIPAPSSPRLTAPRPVTVGDRSPGPGACLEPVGQLGADIAVGSKPTLRRALGCGGPHAALFRHHDPAPAPDPGRGAFWGWAISPSGRQPRPAPGAADPVKQHIRRELRPPATSAPRPRCLLA